MTMADRIVVLRSDSIVQVDKPVDPFKSPGDVVIASFIGSPKITYFEAHGAQPTKGVASPFPVVRQSVVRTVAITPEHIRHAPGDPPLAGTVEISHCLSQVTSFCTKAASFLRRARDFL
jgi:ABC-type sugar transport system ATPase subunit